MATYLNISSTQIEVQAIPRTHACTHARTHTTPPRSYLLAQLHGAELGGLRLGVHHHIEHGADGLRHTEVCGCSSGAGPRRPLGSWGGAQQINTTKKLR